MNFGASSNIAYFPLDQNGRMDCFKRGHSFSRLANVLLERQGGEVEDNRVKTGPFHLFRACARVRMVRIEKDWIVKLIAQTLDQSRDLADSHKTPSPSDAPTITGTFT